MKINSLLKPGNILFISEPCDKWQLIEKMVQNIISKYPEETEEIKALFSPAIMEREQDSSTGIGSGIALPHARIKGLHQPIISLSIIKKGIDFEAADRKPVHLVFMFLFPAEKYDFAVKTQAAFVRFLSNPSNIGTLLKAQTAENILFFLEEQKINVSSPIVAEDLMRKPKVTLSPSITLHNATALMGRKGVDAAAVLDENQNIIGQLDSIYLLQKDLPDYIQKMHSVPHVHDFNPFSRYFSSDAKVLVENIMNPDFAGIDPDGSLLEVIFLLSVKKNSLIYVCKDGKLLGVIDRITVLDKIFNL